MSENKDESNSPAPTKAEEASDKEESKMMDESSKDSEKESLKEEKMEEGSEKEESEKEESEKEESESDEEMGLLDRPVEVTGCRARKKVERLEYNFTVAKEKTQEISEGKGQKLGDCPRIELQIQKTSVQDLKTLHKVLFNRLGSANEIKKNLRKFSGFPFDKNSAEFKKKKSQCDKMNISVLKQLCEVLDLERGGHKDDLVSRVLEFLMNPKDSGKKVPTKKKSVSKGRKKSADKKGAAKNKKTPKAKKESSEDDDEDEDENKDEKDEDKDVDDSDIASSNDEASTKDDDEDEEKSDIEEKKKPISKGKKAAKPTPKKAEKKETPKKEIKKSPAKGTKRKKDESSNSDEDDSGDVKPVAKKSKIPSDDEIKKLVKRILDAADLQEITMKKVIKQVADAYPDCDLSHKKAFIKTTIKSVIS